MAFNFTQRFEAAKAKAAAESDAMDLDVDVSPENRFLVHAGSGGNVFLTGMAGTGKSTLLRRFLDLPWLRSKTIAVTAPTGV